MRCRAGLFALVLAATTVTATTVTATTVTTPAAAQDAPPAPLRPPQQGPSDAERAEFADLVSDLGAPEAHVRDQARGDIVKLGEVAVPYLMEALANPNPRTRVEAARALGAIGGPAAAPALDALRKAAADADAALAAAAREAMTAIDGGTPRLADVRRRIAEGAGAARLRAVGELASVAAEEQVEAAVAAVALCHASDPAVRVAALRALATLGHAAFREPGTSADVEARRKSLISALSGAFSDEVTFVRAAGVESSLALRDPTLLVDALAWVHAARSDPRNARPWLLAALAECADAAALERRVNAQTPTALVMTMDGGEDASLCADIDALAAVRPVQPGAVQALAVTAVQSKIARVRRQAALALGALGDDGTNVAVDALVALLNDKESRAQVEAAAALRQILASMGERPWKRSVLPADVQKSISAGVDWLVAHQDEDGSWDGDGFEKHDPAGDPSGGAAKDSYDEGLTALATLALARSGAVPLFGETDAQGAALRRALVKLISLQDAEGCYGRRGIKHWIYTQAIGTRAMTEAYRRTGSPLWGDSAQRALDFLAACRNPDGAWRYDVRPSDTDTSVNGAVVQALRAGERSGLTVDRAGYARVLAYLDSATDAATGAVGYQAHTRESARTNEMLKKFPPSQTTAMTSSACVQRLLLGRDARTDPLLAKCLELVRKTPPVWDEVGGRTDLYSWMAGTEALSFVGGDAWLQWKKALRDALLPNQCGPKTGARAGSWDPADPWGPDGGRIYSTAAAVLCLETHQGQIPPLPRDPTLDGRGLRAARALEAAAKDAANHESVREAARAALAAVR